MTTRAIAIAAAVATTAAVGGAAVATSHTSATTAAKPSITLTSAKQSGKRIRLSVSVKNFILAPAQIGGPNRPGRGHFHVFVTGKYVAAAAAKTTTVNPGPLTVGTLYRVRVQLATNSHGPIGAKSNVITIRWK
jgi:hypothetical protein